MRGDGPRRRPGSDASPESEAPVAAPRLHLRTLGAVELRRAPSDPEPLLAGVKPILVPVVLATVPGHAAERSYLAELIWAGSDRSRAKASLRQALHHLGKHGEGGGVVSDRGTLRLDPGALGLDLWAFDEAIRRRDHERAIALYRGPFCAGIDDGIGEELAHWIDAQDDRLRIALEAAYAELIAERLRDGAVAGALRLAQTFASANPLSETAQLTLIRTLHAAGEGVRALQVYEGYRSLLESELGGRPDPAAEAALARIRQEAIRAPRPTEVVYVGAGNGGDEDSVGASAPSTGNGSRDRAPDSSGTTTRLAWALAAAGWIAAGVLATIDLRGGGGDAATDDTGEVRFGVVREEGRVGDVVWRGGRLAFEEAPITPAKTFVEAGGRSFVTAVSRTGGVDIVRVDPASGDTAVLTDAPMDEHPAALSPDGRYLLFMDGRGAEDGAYRRGYAILDRGSGQVTTTGLESPSSESGAWSPDGAWIAVTIPDGGGAVVVARPDGSGARRLGEASLPAEYPSWSPDGARVAMLVRTGVGRELSVARLDGTGATRVTQLGVELTTPVWFAEDLVALVLDARTPDARVIAVRVSTGAVVHALSVPGAVHLVGDLRGIPRVPWIDSVVVRVPTGGLAPGATARLEAALVDSSGAPAIPRAAGIRWSSSDPSVLEVDTLGALRAHGRGRATITAEVPGWRRTDVEIRSAAVALDSTARLVFEEDWSGGLDPDRWTVWGHPLPSVHRAGGRDGGSALLANGDASHQSGVTSVERWSARAGLTLELEALAPFDGRLHQGLGFGFDDWPAPRRAMAPTSSAWPVFIFDGSKGWGATVAWRSDGVRIDWPMDRWRHYALQIEPDGTPSLVVDGRLRWRGLPPEGGPPNTPVHVVLSNASVGIEIRHGRIRVYEGERYVPGTGAGPALSGGR